MALPGQTSTACGARTATSRDPASRRRVLARGLSGVRGVGRRRRLGWFLLALHFFAGITFTGCTRVSDTQRFPLVSERLTIARTIPEPGAVIALDAQIDFCFSGYVDPRALDDFDASLTSGRVGFDTQLELQLFAWHPPGSPTGPSAEAWCPGSVLSIRPKVPLHPGVLHRLRLAPSAVGWAGEGLDITTPGWVEDEKGPAYLLEFTVDPAAVPEDTGTEGDSDGDGDGDTDTDGEPAGPTLRDLFAPGQVFAVDHPACSCHREAGLAQDRLDLRDPATAFADLVLPTGLMATGFPMISPRRPSESYLVQTLLREPDGSALYGVLGEPMPPDEPLPHPDMVMIVRWIEAGALP